MTDSFKALGDPHRQNILRLLARQEMGACEIIQAIGLAQPTIAHHLRILKQAGLISSQKEGKFVFYTLNKDGLKGFLDQVHCFFEEISCFSCAQTKPSLLRQNPDLCAQLGCIPEVCETEIQDENNDKEETGGK
jgi:ArsR family transcriptional regulator